MPQQLSLTRCVPLLGALLLGLTGCGGTSQDTGTSDARRLAAAAAPACAISARGAQGTETHRQTRGTPYLTCEVTRGHARFSALQAAQAPPGSGAVPSGKPLRVFDLTRDQGWSHTTGVRATVDSSYNRRGQTTFGPDGMTITAAREGRRIVSSDTQGRFAPLPNHFAIEADITFGGYLGTGMFPAFWLRPAGPGEGELDVFEFMGNRLHAVHAPDRALTWKTTVITTSSDHGWEGLEKSLMPPDDPLTTHRWRYEKTPGKVATYLDGVLLAQSSRAEFDAAHGAGSWDRDFEHRTQQWYPRFSYQVGPPADGRSYDAAGPVPQTWQRSTMNVSRMVVYPAG